MGNCKKSSGKKSSPAFVGQFCCPIFGTSKGSKCFLLCAVGAVPSWLLAARSSCARIISVATDQMVSLHHQGSGSSGSLGGSRNGDKSTWRCWFFWTEMGYFLGILRRGCKGLHTHRYKYKYIYILYYIILYNIILYYIILYYII